MATEPGTHPPNADDGDEPADVLIVPTLIPPSVVPDPPRLSHRPILHRVLTLSAIDMSLPPHSPLFRLSKVRSVDNLLLLAQDPAFQREAAKVVWRPQGEKKKRLARWEDVVKHAGFGGLRAGTIAFLLRSGVNLVLLLFRVSPKRLRVRMLLHSLFGEDSFRFGATFGSFVFLYKLVLNILPLIRQRVLATATAPTTPSPGTTRAPTPELDLPSPQGKLTRFAPDDRPPEENDLQRTDFEDLHPTRLDAALAGAISSLGLLFEKKHRRVLIAQQVFVRGLQALVLAYNLTIPHGEVLTFGLACGQIMYAFLLRAETIPRGYVNWIQSASKVTGETVEINRTLVRTGKFDVDLMRNVRNRQTTTPHNRSVLDTMIERALTMGDFGPPFVVCEATHPWIDSCWDVPLDRFFAVAKWMAPVYTALHFIPAIVFRPKRFLNQPVWSILRTAWSTARSCAFLGTFVIIYQGWFCFKHQMAQRPGTPAILKKFFGSRFSFWLGGFMTCASVFIEEKKRRAELAMYCLPKGLESAWRMLRIRKLMFRVPGGEAVLAALGMAMVMRTYQHDPGRLSRLIRGILYQFIGPN